MLIGNRPGIDPEISPRAGFSRGGQPLSYSRAPSPDLAPWIGRFYATYVDAPPEHLLDCGIFNDCSMARVQLRGNWVAETADGTLRHGRAAMIFGPQSRLMRVSVIGGFTSIGCSFRPGTGHALHGRHMTELVDRLVLGEEFGWPVGPGLDALDKCDSAETAIDCLERMVSQFIIFKGARPPDPLTVAFELIALTNPDKSIGDCADECMVDRKQLERIVLRDFGMPPKQVLRRARALDMAAHLRGVADVEEADELVLRYYDQSHQIHEFTELFGMSPKQFVARPQPILTLALETRQAQRLEALARLAPGAKRPWQ